MEQTNLKDLYLDQSKDLYWMISLDFQLIYANKSFLRLMKELTGKDKKLNESVFSDGFDEDQNEKYRDYYSRALKGEYFEVEDQSYHPLSNEIRFGQNTFEPLLGHDQKVFAVACHSKDITGIVKQRSEANLQSEQSFQALLKEGSGLSGVIDPKGNYIYVSPTSSAILGTSPQEFIGKNVLDFVHPDDAERILISLQKMATENRVVVEPFRFQNHQKKWRWLETVLSNSVDDPAVNGIVVNSRDITDIIEKDNKLKLFESVIKNTKDAILITEAEADNDLGQKILYVNKAFTKMTGYEAEDVIGKTPKLLQGPNSNQEGLAKLGRAIRNWEAYELTTINYRKNGEEFWINLTVTPVADDKGYYTHWFAIERDVTEEKIKELENQLLAQISLAFKIENDPVIAAKQLCKSVSEIGNFDWVELWTANLEKKQLLLFSSHLAKAEDEKFYAANQEFNVNVNLEGLWSEQWFKGVQLLWSDIEESPGFLRRNAAKKIGLKSVMGIPLFYNDELLGVLKIGTKKSANYLANYFGIFQRLEGFIGSELNRKKLENDLSHLFNSIPDIICVLDFKGRFLKINKSGCDLLGYNEERILYHNFHEFSHPDDKEIFENQVMGLEGEENIFKLETRCITSEGSIVWLKWYCNSTLKEGLIYTSASNITKEKELFELNSEARSMAKIGSWEVNLINQNVFWSKEIHKLHDTDSGSFVPNFENGLNFFRKDFHSTVKLSFQKCISEGDQFDAEVVIITAKKKERWVRLLGNAEFENGKCKRVFGSLQDINDRKESEIRLQSLADNLPGVMYQYILYPDGTDRVKYVSKGVQDILGFSSEKVLNNLNLVWDRIEAAGELVNLKKTIADSIKTKTKWTARWKYIMPNGETRNHLGSGSPKFLANGTIIFNSLILDVTQDAINQVLLEQEKLNYENLFNFNPQPTWLLDDESFKILHANIAAQKTYGYSLDDFLNMSFIQLHPKEEEQLIVNKFTSNEEHFSGNQFSHILSDGKEIKVEIYFKEIKSKWNSGVIVQSNDISETLKYIQTIEIQNKKLRSIAWTQSHEVRAPLSRILGIMNMIELQPDDRDEILFWLKQLRVSSNELDDIIKKIVHETRQIKQQ
jgi:PAS domain S-box-containing protein